MMNRLPKHLFDALSAARLAVTFLGQRSEAEYAADLLVRSAVERRLEILGEASKRMLDAEPGLRSRCPELGLAIGMRNQLMHGYDRVVDDVVVDTVRHHLPVLQVWLEAELQRFEQP